MGDLRLASLCEFGGVALHYLAHPLPRHVELRGDGLQRRPLPTQPHDLFVSGAHAATRICRRNE